MSKKKFWIKLIALLLAGGIIAISTVTAHGATKANVSADTKNIYFSNSIPSASAGSQIVNCLGYFVTVNAKETSLGTVFIHGDTTTGRSYYSPYDRTTGKLICVSGRPAMETRIPLKDIVNAFGDEYGANTAETVRKVFEKKYSGTCEINSMVCTAVLTKNNSDVQKGWGLHTSVSGASFPDIAYTQVKLKNSSITIKNILVDLSTLNQHPSYQDALKQKFNCIEINPSHNMGGTASVLCVNGVTGSSAYSALTPEKTFCGELSTLTTDIRSGYYGISVSLKGGSTPVAEYKPGKVGKVEYSVSEPASSASVVKSMDSLQDNKIPLIVFGCVCMAGLVGILIVCRMAGKAHKKV